jgi:hypothetical protein
MKIGQKISWCVVFLCLGITMILLAAESFLRLLVPDVLSGIPVDRTFNIYCSEHYREHPYSLAATNLLRIAMVGDSITIGVGNHRYDRFASRLEWLMNLNNDVTPCEVEIFAKPTATYQQAKLLQHAFEYKANLILFIVHLNDTENWSQPADIIKLRENMGIKAPPSSLRPFLKCSALAKLTYRKLEERRQAKAFYEYYNYIYRPDYPGLQMFANALAGFHKECMEKNVPLAVVLFPLLNQDTREGKYPFERMNGIVRDICEKEKIPFLDMLEAYRFADRTRDQNIYLLDQHPSEIGHRIAADSIFHFLLRQSLVPDAYRPHRLEDQLFISKWKKKLDAMQIEYDGKTHSVEVQSGSKQVEK